MSVMFRTTLLVCTALVFGCGQGTEQNTRKPNTLKPFSSDGCSLFPDSSSITSHDWCACCLQHDKAYWRGGSEAQRQVADQQLRECVIAKTDNKALAGLMYEGVRIGGSPYFHTWYRWGYGWTNDRRYQSLSVDENALADRLMDEYQNSDSPSVCQVIPSN